MKKIVGIIVHSLPDAKQYCVSVLITKFVEICDNDQKSQKVLILQLTVRSSEMIEFVNYL